MMRSGGGGREPFVPPPPAGVVLTALDSIRVRLFRVDTCGDAVG